MKHLKLPVFSKAISLPSVLNFFKTPLPGPVVFSGEALPRFEGAEGGLDCGGREVLGYRVFTTLW
jgi:hypothetical protein